MENKRKPEIVIKTSGTKAELFIDGKRLDGVIGYEVAQSAKEDYRLPRLQIDLKATNVTLETDVLPELPMLYKPFYISKSKLVEAGLVTWEQLDSLDGIGG